MSKYEQNVEAIAAEMEAILSKNHIHIGCIPLARYVLEQKAVAYVKGRMKDIPVISQVTFDDELQSLGLIP